MDSRFPVEIFPKQYQVFIQHLKDVSGFDTNLSSLSFLSASASCIGNSVNLWNGKYSDRPILWCVLVAGSGSRKSHIMEKPFEYLSTKDKEQMILYQEAISASHDKDEITKPKSTILKNATLEAIHQVHKDNPRGIVLCKDEIIGMFKDFNRYNNGGGDKQEFLELFNGKSMRINRATRETLYLPETCVNIIGGIQNDRLNYIANEENIADGFYPRFLFSRVTEHKPLTFSFESLNQNIQNQSNLIFERLTKIESLTLNIDLEIQRIYKDWFDKSQAKYFNDPLKIQSKLETYLWRFCIVLDMLDQVATNQDRNIIKPETIENAIILAEYFRNEATEIYKETLRDGVLEGEPMEFQKIYRKLKNREYSTSELVEVFSKVWGSDNVHKKLKVKELFTKIRFGVYIKSIRDAV